MFVALEYKGLSFFGGVVAFNFYILLQRRITASVKNLFITNALHVRGWGYLNNFVTHLNVGTLEAYTELSNSASLGCVFLCSKVLVNLFKNFLIERQLTKNSSL